MIPEPIILNKAQFIAIRGEIYRKMNQRQAFLLQVAQNLYKRLKTYENPTIVEVLHEVEGVHSITSVDETNLVLNSLFDSDLKKPSTKDFIEFSKKMFFIAEDNCYVEFSSKHNTFFFETLDIDEIMPKERTHLNQILQEIFRGRNA